MRTHTNPTENFHLPYLRVNILYEEPTLLTDYRILLHTLGPPRIRMGNAR